MSGSYIVTRPAPPASERVPAGWHRGPDDSMWRVFRSQGEAVAAFREAADTEESAKLEWSA